MKWQICHFEFSIKIQRTYYIKIEAENKVESKFRSWHRQQVVQVAVRLLQQKKGGPTSGAINVRLESQQQL